jgi:hypothetical protein
MKEVALCNLLATFCHGKGSALILTKNGLGYSLGAFFPNSSGHPAANSRMNPNFLIQPGVSSGFLTSFVPV